MLRHAPRGRAVKLWDEDLTLAEAQVGGGHSIYARVCIRARTRAGWPHGCAALICRVLLPARSTPCGTRR